MGYVAVDSKRVVFAAQTKLQSGALSNVELYEIDIASRNEKHVQRVLNQDDILPHCQNATSPPENCTDISTFYPQFSSNGDMVFAFRAWNALGGGIGNQALAMKVSTLYP